jgi:AcrR family transcriptional regulator
MDRATRDHILDVALRRFADRGYAGTSVQEIVDAAKVAKPMLYYYFESKAGLYQALIDMAHDERLRIMSEAANRREGLREKLEAILVALFDFIQKHRDLVRLAFASAFAAPGEMPEGLHYREKCERNFEFIHQLMRDGLARGELDGRFESRELAIAWYGLMNIYTVGQVLQPGISYCGKTASGVVDLFFNGAEARNGATRQTAECGLYLSGCDETMPGGNAGEFSKI